MLEKLEPKGIKSQEKNPELIKILRVLVEGGSLWHFYLDGGVAVHNKEGEPTNERCNIQTFLDLREKGLINAGEKKETGYPFYANNTKSQVYRISEAGSTCLE